MVERGGAVQAIASGKMDVMCFMCFGIGPAMVTRGKGIKLKVIAAGIVNQIAVIAQGDLVKYFDKYGKSRHGDPPISGDGVSGASAVS